MRPETKSPKTIMSGNDAANEKNGVHCCFVEPQTRVSNATIMLWGPPQSAPVPKGFKWEKMDKSGADC